MDHVTTKNIDTTKSEAKQEKHTIEIATRIETRNIKQRAI